MPAVVPLSARQFVVGDADVPQHVPRAEMTEGTPREVTFAPRVAPVVVVDVAVGVVTVGTAGVSAQIVPLHDVPEIQLPIAVVDARIVVLSLTSTVFAPFVIGYDTPAPDADVEYVFNVVAL